MNAAAPLWAAAATGVQVGAAMVATRFVVDAAGPASLGFLRYLIGLACLVPVLVWRPRSRFALRDVLPICLLGIGQFAVLIVLLNYALRHIPAARASLIFSTFPMMTMLLGVSLGRERLTRWKSAGLILTFAGVAIVLGGGAFDGPPVAGRQEWAGALAALAAAACGAICSISYGPYVARYSALPVTALAMLAAVVALSGLSLAESLPARLPAITSPQWAAIAFIGISSGAGFFCWIYALGHASPALVTMFLALGPATAALGDTLLLGEPLPRAALPGLGCVIAGLRVALGSPERTELP